MILMFMWVHAESFFSLFQIGSVQFTITERKATWVFTTSTHTAKSNEEIKSKIAASVFTGILRAALVSQVCSLGLSSIKRLQTVWPIFLLCDGY